MKSNITILRLTQYDPARLDELCKLRDGLMAHHGIFTSSDCFKNFMLKHFGEETMLVFLILDADTPIGYGLAFDVEEHAYMPEWTRKGYVTQYYVDAKYRGQGVGAFGMDYIHDWFKSRGITDVLLNVDVNNEVGNRFWEQQDYVPYATRMRKRLI